MTKEPMVSLIRTPIHPENQDYREAGRRVRVASKRICEGCREEWLQRVASYAELLADDYYCNDIDMPGEQ
jgi:hypothetical protein